MARLRITDPTSKKNREVEGLKVKRHKEYDKYGKQTTNRYAEYTILGNNRKWTGFAPLNEFKKMNPKIKI